MEAGEVLATCIQHEMDHWTASCSSTICRRSSARWCARSWPSSASTWRDRQSGPPFGWPRLRGKRGLYGAGRRRRFLPARIHPASGVAMRIVFAGTPEFAVSSLRAAARHHEVVAVYTQPDRPAGRGRGPAPSPVKLEAVARGIPVYQPESLKDAAAQQQLRDLQPDLMVVVAYGLILPKAVLAIPTHGCWNVHASLLPRWRGAAPIQRAIRAGDAKTGVCLMQMEAGRTPARCCCTRNCRSRPPIPAASCMTSWPSLVPRCCPMAWACCARASSRSRGRSRNRA